MNPPYSRELAVEALRNVSGQFSEKVSNFSKENTVANDAKELRRYQRYSCNLPAKITIGNIELEGVALNVGFKGMLIVINHPQDIDTDITVNVSFKLPFIINDTKILSRVRWKDERNIGVEFLSLKEKEIDGLKRFIDSILDIEEHHDIQEIQSRVAINALIETTLSKLSLERQLGVALEIILTVPWFSSEHKGAVFLFEKNTQVLKMKTGINMPELKALCSTVAIGQCLCGRAGELKKIIFRNSLDKEHTITYDGMKRQGCYCVPFLENSELIGVLNIYVSGEHAKNKDEESFLLASAAIIADLIKFRRTEESLNKTGYFQRSCCTTSR
ncbi:hypothetical protein CCP3SC1_190032 [Gammaproteobacteria bacterium]